MEEAKVRVKVTVTMATELEPVALIKKKQEAQKNYWEWKLDTKTELEKNLFNPTFYSIYIDTSFATIWDYSFKEFFPIW